MTTLAHVSDVHLGAPLRGLPDYPGCPQIDAVETAYQGFEAMVAGILTGGYDGVLIAGDLFDRTVTDTRALDVATAALSAFVDAGMPVALIYGNHDAASDLAERFVPPPGVWLAPTDRADTVCWDDVGIAVHGQSIEDPCELRDLAAGYPPPVSGLRNIGMLHTSLDGARSKRILAPTSSDRLAAHGYDYWALGHVHHRMVDAARAVAFAGSVHPAKRVELGPRGFLSVSFDGPPGTIPGLEPVNTAPVVRERMTAQTPDEVAAAFAAYALAPGCSTVVWSLDGPADLLGAARELAAGYDGFVVARGK